jgi:hypothetical protein
VVDRGSAIVGRAGPAERIDRPIERAAERATQRARPIAPSASSRSASCTTFASMVRGSMPAEKLCASMACRIPGRQAAG